jgi:hypothetical protein
MQLSDVKRWQEAEAVNTDPCGRAVVTFARAWAEAMERRLAALPSPFVEHAVELVAEPAMDDARRLRPPSEGLTGFQLGCVIDLLAAAWPRGKRLEELEEIEELATIIVLVVMYPELAKASITEALKAVYGEPPGAAPHA